jgi:hypothetical protein
MKQLWIEDLHSIKKNYLGGLITANISWAITGVPGYVLRINGITFKKRFKHPDDAKEVADRFVHKRIKEWNKDI